MARVKLTERRVETIKPSATKDVWVWDSEVPGLAVRCKPSGVRTYVVQYRNRAKRTRRMAIGQCGRVRLEDAREHARDIFGRVARGEDPASERKATAERGTVEDLWARYLKDAKKRNRESSIAAYERSWAKHIQPKIGDRPVEDVDRPMIQKLHSDACDAAGPTAANRALAVVSTMFKCAENWGLRPDGSNPARLVKRYAENKRQRYLSRAELQRLGKALSAHLAQADTRRPSETDIQYRQRARNVRSTVYAIRALLFTGCRKSEVATLRWRQVDLGERVLRLENAKTVSRNAEGVKLDGAAFDLFVELRGDTEPDPDALVFPSRDIGRPVNLDDAKAWPAIRDAAELADFRLHDLRHTYGGRAASLGYGLHVTGKILGHSQPSTTARYAHLEDAPVREANEAIGRSIAADLEGKPEAEVIPLRGSAS